MAADPQEIDKMCQHLTALICEKLGLRADGLRKALARAGRRLPRWVRRDGAALVAAGETIRNPRLARITDGEGLSQAASRIEVYLSGLDPVAARARARSILLAEIGFRVAVIGALFLTALAWHG